MTDRQLLDHALARSSPGLRLVTKKWLPLDWHHLGGVYRDEPTEVKEAPCRPDKGTLCFRVRCTCRDLQHLDALDEPPPSRRWISPVVELYAEHVGETRAGTLYWDAWVWLGQCDDCGTIWYAIVR